MSESNHGGGAEMEMGRAPDAEVDGEVMTENAATRFAAFTKKFDAPYLGRLDDAKKLRLAEFCRSYHVIRKLDPADLKERIRRVHEITRVGDAVKAAPKLAKKASSLALPDTTTPEELAERLGWSARRVRVEAKKLGACLIMGNRMVLTQADVTKIMESHRCPSSSTCAATSGITAARLPKGDYAALQASRKPRKNSQSARLPKSKTTNGNVISMDRKRS
jgi:hypothetical protein